jgi:nicotinamidase-related amidase
LEHRKERKEAFLVTDMLQEFVYGKISAPKAKDIIGPIRNLLDAAHSTKIPVVYVCDSHFPNDPEMKVWGQHAMRGSDGAQIIKELQPAQGDYILEKRVYSAFHETGLELLLRDLNVDSVVIGGLLTEICVRHTAADAFMRGFAVRVPSDCVQAFTEEKQQEGLEYLRKMYGANITDSSEIIKEWKNGT